MIEKWFEHTSADPYSYVKWFGESFVLLLLYVDDMLILGKDMFVIGRLKELRNSFAMKDLGLAKKILGMQISRDRRAKRIWLSQERYIKKVLERFGMKDAKLVGSPLPNYFRICAKQYPKSDEEKNKMNNVPYASAIESLMYAMVCTRPGIAYVVGITSRVLANPGKEHWAVVKWVLCYLRGSSKVSLCFGEGPDVLCGYTNADMARDIDTRKSTSGFVILFEGRVVSWQSKLQKCIALSMEEVEYVATTELCKEMLWMKKFLLELRLKQDEYVV